MKNLPTIKAIALKEMRVFDRFYALMEMAKSLRIRIIVILDLFLLNSPNSSNSYEGKEFIGKEIFCYRYNPDSKSFELELDPEVN
jgi:hypothetical protein